MKPISMIALCAAILVLLASCAAQTTPDPALSEITADAGQLPETPPDPKQNSPEPPDEPAGEPVEEPAAEPAEEPAEEPNPIPFFVPDPDPDDPDAPQLPEPVRIPVPIPFSENAVPAVSRKISDPDQFGGDAPYFGRWIVQSRGIDVACYLSLSQEVVDAEDAAAFFQLGDQYVIGDHKNQDFRSLGSCQPGDLACLETEEGIAVYVCTAVIPGHNSENAITDDAGNSIEYNFNTGGITCYTCNDDWQNIHIVLFSPVA